MCSLEHENPRELDLGYVLVIHKLKNRSRDVIPVYKGLMYQRVLLDVVHVHVVHGTVASLLSGAGPDCLVTQHEPVQYS